MTTDTIVRGRHVSTIVLADVARTDSDVDVKAEAIRAAGPASHTLVGSRISRTDDGRAVVTLDRVAS